MKDIEAIIGLYEDYQYKLEKYDENYVIFSLGSGIYPGVDILVDKNMPLEDSQKIRKEYSDAGYATNIITFNSIDELENALFNQFFRPKVSRERLLAHYNEYTRGIMRPYITEKSSPKYKYIEVPYVNEEDFVDKKSELKLLDHLCDIINEKKAKLIIVEAPAGFGKTSTAYELVARLCNDNSNRRPFFMELAKDRSASSFRYLLLSQIEQNFQVLLKNDIVIKNIKNGRIPLIIDGFDELLSKDLDQNIGKVRFEEIETMLSTIAELLTDNSKIILTTRKTAIFSGEKFIDWYFAQQEKGNEFTVSRIQLMEPSPSEWLSARQLAQLPETITKISNPVLLSYLRYVDENQFASFTNPDVLVQSYFNFIYKREIERQSLPFKTKEQQQILENLGAYFAACDITADNRSDVLDAILTLSNSLINEFVTPDRDERSLANTLTNHALLDRHTSGKVGFINDYVFGALLGRAFIDNVEGIDMIDSLSTNTAYKLIDACSIWVQENRTKLATRLDLLKELHPVVLLDIDRYLLRKISHPFNSLSVEGEDFENLSFDENGLWENCTFTKCNFKGCILDFNKIKDCTFIACSFDCETNSIGNNASCNFYPENPFYDNILDNEDNLEEDANDSQYLELDKSILCSFFRKGSLKTRINKVSTITEKLNESYPRKVVLKRIERFVAKKFIHEDGDNVWILTPGSDYLNTLKSFYGN